MQRLTKNNYLFVFIICIIQYKMNIIYSNVLFNKWGFNTFKCPNLENGDF